MDTEDGRLFIKNLAYYVRTHEKALANALQLQNQSSRRAQPQHASNAPAARPSTNSSTTSLSSQPGSSQAPGAFASALSLSSFGFGSQPLKPAKLYLTPNQLYFLLSRFEELGVVVGAMNVRLESIHADSSYVSFLSQTKRPKGRSSDQDSLHSVSSVRSVMSNMSSMLSSFSLSGNSAAKLEKRKAAELEDIRYLYSAFTKIPCLKLVSDHRIRRITGFEEFPFDTAVPLHAFKNVTVLEVVNEDFRSFFGWDRLAEQLRSLTVKRAELDDPTDLLTNIVLDDMEKRRRRSTKSQPSPTMPQSAASPAFKQPDLVRSYQNPPSLVQEGRYGSIERSGNTDIAAPAMSYSKPSNISRLQSSSPPRPSTGRRGSGNILGMPQRRSSISSSSSNPSNTPRTSSSNLLLATSGLSPLKWRFLRHLSLADNGLTTLSSHSLIPLVPTLYSLDLSSNLFTEIPDSLATLMSLRALNLSNCLINSIQTLAKNPLPAITVLNLRGNRLKALAGIEKLLSLERLDLRDNQLRDPAEMARLTGMPEFRDLYILRNPFCKTYTNHRITIYNLFRKSPGYTTDITIDSTGPTYSERRQLVERVPEAANVPVVPPPLEDEPDLPVQADPNENSTQADKAMPDSTETPQTPADESLSKSQRRRKAPRRRVVDMAQDSSPRSPGTTSSMPGSPEPSFVTAIQTPTTARVQLVAAGDGSPSVQRPGDGKKQKEQARPPSKVSPPERSEQAGVDTSTNQAGPPASLSLSNEQYKKRIEALKSEYGNGWLSALGEDAWSESSASVSPAYKEKEASAASKASLAKT